MKKKYKKKIKKIKKKKKKRISNEMKNCGGKRKR